MNGFPIQVTCYCSEEDVKVWKDFLEKKGHNTITKTREERYHKGFVTKYSLFRALTHEEKRGLKDGRYRMNKDGLFDNELARNSLKKMPFKSKEEANARNSSSASSDR